MCGPQQTTTWHTQQTQLLCTKLRSYIMWIVLNNLLPSCLCRHHDRNMRTLRLGFLIEEAFSVTIAHLLTLAPAFELSATSRSSSTATI